MKIRRSVDSMTVSIGKKIIAEFKQSLISIKLNHSFGVFDSYYLSNGYWAIFDFKIL